MGQILRPILKFLNGELMKVVFRNFLRNKMVNLSATSVRYFLPEIEIHCLTLFKKDMSDYNNQEPLHDYIIEHTAQTKYVSGIDIHDDIDDTKTSGYANADNSCYFTEGYNLIMEHFKDLDDKVLILSEDHFFQKNQTLKELLDNEFTAAYGDWDSYGDFLRANGSILCINPQKVKHLFPLPETRGVSIEWTLGHFLKQIEPNKRHKLSTREALNYHGDGCYTNSSEIIISKLKEVKIL